MDKIEWRGDQGFLSFGRVAQIIKDPNPNGNFSLWMEYHRQSRHESVEDAKEMASWILSLRGPSISRT